MDEPYVSEETSSYILINLFKGYLLAPHKEFNMHIKQKMHDYKLVKL